jgi:hypothetical protein
MSTPSIKTSSRHNAFFELKDRFIAKPSYNDLDIMFGLDSKVLSPAARGRRYFRSGGQRWASYFSEFLLQRMELQRKQSALLLKREKETEQRASLEEVIDDIKGYEQVLLLLDQTCAEAENDGNAVLKGLRSLMGELVLCVSRQSFRLSLSAVLKPNASRFPNYLWSTKVANSESYNPRGWPIFALRSEPFTSPA